MKEIEKSSGIDDKVVQDQRQRDDNDHQDDKQDQPKKEEDMQRYGEEASRRRRVKKDEYEGGGQERSDLALQKEKFQEYAHYNTESLKKTILSYLNSIEKRIDERACHEEELRIKEQNVKERRNEVKWLNEIELQKQESMMNVGTILDDILDVTEQQCKKQQSRE
ncbi:hypothetical protein Tco_0046119 [Tanacetum coccineum]